MRNPCFHQVLSDFLKRILEKTPLKHRNTFERLLQATFADTPQAEKAGLVARVVPLGAEVEEVWMKSIHCLRFVKT